MKYIKYFIQFLLVIISFFIFELIIFSDLKKGPIISKIFPLTFEDKLCPKILKTPKLKITMQN